MGGGQYEHAIGRERLFAEALFGRGRTEPQLGLSGDAGRDRFLYELSGRRSGYAHQHALCASHRRWIPVHEFCAYPGLTDHASLSGSRTSHLFRPHVGGNRLDSSSEPGFKPRAQCRRTPPASELYFEDLNSFGHFHVFGNTWWSYLHLRRRVRPSFLGAIYRSAPGLCCRDFARRDSEAAEQDECMGNSTQQYVYRRSGTRESRPSGSACCGEMRKRWSFTTRQMGNHCVHAEGALAIRVLRELQPASERWIPASLEWPHGSPRWRERLSLLQWLYRAQQPGLDEMMWNAGVVYRLRGKQEQR